MPLAKRYDPKSVEPRLRELWRDTGVYHFDRRSDAPVYSIDTPPPTVSGHLHLGHIYSYSHADFVARFFRMNGHNVFYPMGYDDNGLPTERLVETRLGLTAETVGRRAFIDACLAVSKETEAQYEELWGRLGLSVDWQYTYSTIDDLSRQTSQRSFLDLYRQDRAYRRKAPTIWCPGCHTAIAQAEVNDLEEESEFVTIPFSLEDGTRVEIATTRPELLPACVALFVHPGDARFAHLVGMTAQVPLFGQLVPILEDAGADPDKGTGAVMCCTFGDQADVEWWYTYNLPLLEALDRDGRMTDVAGAFCGLSAEVARATIKVALEKEGMILERRTITHAVRVHERDDRPVEYIVTPQWFIRVLDRKEELIEAGSSIAWHPPHMETRFREWVRNMHWDWCISRQRFYGVTFPVWYCNACGETVTAEANELPIDPTEREPKGACVCGSTAFTPETDVMDTWATSSMSPQIVCKWLEDSDLYSKTFPMSLRAQAHEIIRTWAFDTVVKSLFGFNQLPWSDVLISGWGLAPEGAGKISKSRGGGPMSPGEMLDLYSADAARYWAASTGPGKDAVISEEKIAAGAKLVTKLWNVSGFSARFLDEYVPPELPPALTPSDRWILSRVQHIVERATTAYTSEYDYATAKVEVEVFFWRDLADNYLEFAKKRLYDSESPGNSAARYALYHALLTVVKLFAPVMPFVTEEIYRGLFAAREGHESIHRSDWPIRIPELVNADAERVGDALVEVAAAVRRYKSAGGIPLGAELLAIAVVCASPDMLTSLQDAVEDIGSVTRARIVRMERTLPEDFEALPAGLHVQVGVSN